MLFYDSRGTEGFGMDIKLMRKYFVLLNIGGIGHGLVGNSKIVIGKEKKKSGEAKKADVILI